MKGSYINRSLEGKTFTDEITIGTGVTEFSYTDRKAYEVVDVKDQKHISIREYAYINDRLVSDKSKPVDKLVKRGSKWYREVTFTKDEYLKGDRNYKASMLVNKVSADELLVKGEIKKYQKANVSIGIADYHYDLEF